MKRNLFFISLIISLFIFTNLISAQTVEQKLSEIDQYANKVLQDWGGPGFAIGIVKNDEVIFAKGYGVRELGKPEKVDENTLFAIASNSKSFTTASLAILIDEGKIASWDDKVTKYVPDFQMFDPYVTREITIRDLVSHRSGLGTFSGDLLWYQTDYPTDEIIKRIRFLKPSSSFRSQYGYQNLMFIVAGKVLENVSGKTWSDFVKERLLTPLEMSRTTTSVRDLKDNFASPHNESSGKLAPIVYDNVDNAKAAAGLNSSVKEMANWIRVQLGRGTFRVSSSSANSVREKCGRRIFLTASIPIRRRILLPKCLPVMVWVGR